MLLVCALGLAGCVDFDVTLERDGSGAFKLVWTAPNPRLDLPRFFSPHVKIESVNRMGVGVFSVSGKFDDVTKLPTADFFRQLTIRRDPVAGQDRIRVLFLNRNPGPMVLNQDWVVNIRAVLPAPVRFANRSAERNGRRLAWHVPLADFQERRLLKLSLRYGPPPTPAPAPSAAAGVVRPVQDT